MSSELVYGREIQAYRHFRSSDRRIRVRTDNNSLDDSRLRRSRHCHEKQDQNCNECVPHRKLSDSFAQHAECAD